MRSERRGFALVGALLAMVCIGMTLAGVAFITRQDIALSSARTMSHQAFTTAELAAWRAAATLDSTWLEVAVGTERAVSVNAPFVDTVRASVFRLSQSVFLALGEAGRQTRGGEFLWGRVGLFLTAAADSAAGLRFEPLPGRAWVELP